MTLQDIIDTYNNDHNAYLTKRKTIEEKITRLNHKLEKLEKTRPYVVQNLIIPLAKSLKEYLGLKAYEIYGPFGLENETTIYLSNEGKDGSISICEVETWSLTLHWRYKELDIDHLEYWTGEETNEFAKGTIGWLNGYNHIFKPLPNTLEEIAKVMRHSVKKG